MEMIELIRGNFIIAIPIFAVIVVLGYKFTKKATSVVGVSGDVDYIKKNDPTAQGSYDKKKSETGEPKMTMKDRLELSWQFLYDITDTVLSRFSEADQNEALSIGKVLFENGGRYEHVIDYGIRHNLGTAKDKGQSLVKSA